MLSVVLQYYDIHSRIYIVIVVMAVSLSVERPYSLSCDSDI